MITFPALLSSELRRCLARRAVRVLIAIGLLGVVVTGVVAALLIRPQDLLSADANLARFEDLWRPEGEGTFLPAIIVLLIGAFLGGAVVTGGEWRAGTVTTLCTWEVRRRRLLGARLVACAVLATSIGATLLVLFAAASLPTVVLRGAAGSLDAAWWTEATLAVLRAAAAAGVAAVLGASLASVARATGAAVGILFATQVVLDPVVRAVWPGRAEWLLAENIGTWLAEATMQTGRGALAAGATLFAYALAAAAASLWAFRRFDLPGGG